MNTSTADLIRSILTEDLLKSLKAKDFKTKGDDLQFRLPDSKNKIKSNMVKVEAKGHYFTLKFYTYNPMKHIFRCNLELIVTEGLLKETVEKYLK